MASMGAADFGAATRDEIARGIVRTKDMESETPGHALVDPPARTPEPLLNPTLRVYEKSSLHPRGEKACVSSPAAILKTAHRDRLFSSRLFAADLRRGVQYRPAEQLPLRSAIQGQACLATCLSPSLWTRCLDECHLPKHCRTPHCACQPPMPHQPDPPQMPCSVQSQAAQVPESFSSPSTTL